MEKLTQMWTQSGSFCPKSGQFSKRAGEDFPPPLSCASVSMAEYALIFLNMNKYLWKCLNKLFWLYQGFEYIWSSVMFNRLLKMPRVLNKPGFWIWHGCAYKGYVEFQICLIMALYASVMPEYACVCLNVPQYAWTWLNIADCSWICLKIPE